MTTRSPVDRCEPERPRQAPGRLWQPHERLVAGGLDQALDPPLRLGVSACLLGDEVRFNGGHSRDRFLLHTLGRYVEWVRVCPEVEIGLGTPRESIRLVALGEQTRLRAPKTGADHTEAMQAWSQRATESLADLDLHGFVFKKGSPSCGVHRVRVYDEGSDTARRDGRGMFAGVVMARFPTLPVEEEGRLNDPALRENFFERVFAHQRWKSFLRDPTPKGLVRFHTAHKMTLLSHHPEIYRELGRVVASAGEADFQTVVADYERLFSEALATLASRGRHANVLQHLMGFLKNATTAAEKAELLESIDDYRRGLLPLVVPVVLLNHHFRHRPVPDWIYAQVYLRPYPKELALRNHV